MGLNNKFSSTFARDRSARTAIQKRSAAIEEMYKNIQDESYEEEILPEGSEERAWLDELCGIRVKSKKLASENRKELREREERQRSRARDKARSKKRERQHGGDWGCF